MTASAAIREVRANRGATVCSRAPYKKYKGGAVTIGNPVVDFGGGNLLFAQCIREDSPTNNLCAIIGGTGRFSGARGTAVEDFKHGVEDKKAHTLTLPVNVTFMP